jgi:signal transduction histidine kinase
MKLIIDKKVSIGFLLALLALVSLIFLSFRNQSYYLQTTKDITRENEILFYTEQIQKNLLEIESSQRGYIIIGDSAFLDYYYAANQLIRKSQSQLYEALAGSTPDNLMRFREIERLISEKYQFAETAINARNTNFETSKQIVASYRGKELTDKIRQLTSVMQSEATQKANEYHDERERSMKNFNLTFLVIVGTSVVLLSILFFIINNSINVRVQVDERVRQLNTELEAFSYSISHDLRSPLRVIDGYSQLLEEDHYDKLDDDAKNAIAVIMRNARKMGHLIDDLLEFSRVSKKEIKPVKVDITPIVERITKEVRTHNECKNCVININDLEPAYADQKMIEQVWINLVSNAVKYSSKKEQPIIEIGSVNENGYVTYFVKDNGVFQRLHRPEDFPGTGVGLAIVKRIIHRHGGEVWAESKMNEGATFYFTLPNH